ncbi:LacI family DNA-binding transcriptional regulator [Asanoa sp. WMMD1127]|uniref:LacI family DNA-binding transcriptional regulator n=1 Tax=Asanoa sp. WMMD1127 TaxID=3016107 RepID=UPI0024179A2C|nr:LacI family DNA-binding transcriptional regulator [Asanoa sp. WMMD1127]MDG4825029.1 LacI family DNA-binding transcriptional regulator [Asanoa sp. WMMD1127]
METKKPTLEDVGRMADVSRATASRVINGHQRVSTYARDRVWHAVKQLGYRPNIAARTLAKGNDDVIDVVIDGDQHIEFDRDLYINRLASGIAEALAGIEDKVRVHVVVESLSRRAKGG